jgi:pimeloyl-ACP methyl ester carboxylesterase
MFCAAAGPPPPPGQTARDIVINGRHVAFNVMPGRLPVLVLDAGGGNDSSYWDAIIPALVKRTGSAIISYDRAGLGASDAATPPFRMDDAVNDLETGLRQIGATHDLVLIPHSFAGEVATYLAIRHPDWIKGAILVDTNVPQFFSDAETRHMDEQIQPFVAQMVKNSDKRSRTLVAVAKEYIPVSEAFHKAAWPAAIPCSVIVSESTPFPPQMQSDRDAWTLAHIAFTSAAPNRQLILAKGSSHDIAHDQPGIIVNAAGDLVDRLRAGGAGR